MDLLYKEIDDKIFACVTAHEHGTTGGSMRELRGRTVEEIIDICARYVDLESRVGSRDKKTIKIGDASTEHQVDRHIYHNQKFVAIIEAKGYLDACYYERANYDFAIMKKMFKDLKCCVLTLEKSINENKKGFLDTFWENICDEIFYLCDGNRSSSKPIYQRENFKHINREVLENFITFLEGLKQN
jgi:hypothetical protein